MAHSLRVLSTLLFLVAVHRARAFRCGPGNDSIVCDALQAFKSDVKDPGNILQSWGDGTSFCTWTGITCDAEGSSVTALKLLQNDLSGTISPALGNITSMQSLLLGFNSFSGTVPSELGKLNSLIELALFKNQLSGTLPPELGQLISLEQLEIEENKLSGTIPEQFGQLQSLQYLMAFSNNFEGVIPSSFENLNFLQQLNLNNNHLSGTLPGSVITGMGSLQRLDLSHNTFSGPLPPELGDIEMLNVLKMDGNRFSGELPPELGKLGRLQALILADNQLNGTVPSSICNLPAIREDYCNLTMNDFGCALPDCAKKPGSPIGSCIAQTTQYPVADLCLPYWRPEDSEDCIWMRAIYGAWRIPVPTATPLCRWPGISGCTCSETQAQITALDFSSHSLSGTIPKEIAQLTALNALVLHDNNMGGTIPKWLTELKSLQHLDLSSNNFTGTLPSEFGQLSSLSHLDLSSNSLTGPVPSSFCALVHNGTCHLGSHSMLDSNHFKCPAPACTGSDTACSKAIVNIECPKCPPGCFGTPPHCNCPGVDERLVTALVSEI